MIGAGEVAIAHVTIDAANVKADAGLHAAEVHVELVREARRLGLPDILDGIRPQWRRDGIARHRFVADLAELTGRAEERVLVALVARLVIVGAGTRAHPMAAIACDLSVLRVREPRLVDRRGRRFERA